MRFAKTGVDVGPCQVFHIKRFDNSQRFVRRSIVEDVYFEIRAALLFEAFQACGDIASAIERHDIYGDLPHHFLDGCALSGLRSRLLTLVRAPMNAWPYAAACLGLAIILPIIPAAIDARTRAAPNFPKCFLA